MLTKTKSVSRTRGSSILRFRETKLGAVCPKAAPALLGMSKETPVTMEQEDMNKHMLTAGASGSGKSNLMRILVQRHFTNPREGCLLLDPHGTLYDQLVSDAAVRGSGLIDRIILFDPAGEGDVCGFSPIPKNLDEIPVSTLVTLIAGAMMKAWGSFDGGDSTPRISRWIRNVLTPLVVNRLSLLESVAVTNIQDGEIRKQLLRSVQNTAILDDWHFFGAAPLREKLSYMEGVGNRFVRFVSDEALQLVLGQQEHVLDLADAMRSSKIVLCNLHSQGKIPDEASRLIGLLLATECYRVALLRKKDEWNRPFYVYIDEAKRFMSQQVALALNELRKFGVFFNLSIQNLAQIEAEDRELYDSVMTNTRLKVVMGGLSVEDAKVMTETVMTGFLDLNEAKQEVWQTKVRMVEETRVVRAESRQKTEGESTAVAEGKSRVVTDSVGESHGHGETVTDTSGSQRGSTKSESRGINLTLQEGHGETANETTSQGQNRVFTRSRSQNVASNWNTASGQTENKGETVTASVNESEPSNLLMDEKSRVSHSKGKSENVVRGDTHSESEGGSATEGQSQSEAEGRTVNFSRGKGRSQTSGIGLGQSLQRGNAVTEASSSSHAVSHQESHQIQSGRAVAEGENTSRTVSRTLGKSIGESVSTVPFLKPEEYRELSSRTFVSIEEHMHRALGRVINLPVGVAILKVGSEPPVEIKIPYEPGPRVPEETVRRFKEEVFRRHPECYLPRERARELIEERQRKHFGKVLCLVDHPIEIEVETEEKPPLLPEADFGPFEE